MNSGWTTHEMTQLTVKAQQLFKIEIKRCIKSLSFLHSNHCASTSTSFPCPFPTSPSLNESSINSTSMPAICDPSDSSSFPLLNTFFSKSLSFCTSLHHSLEDISSLELKESAFKEFELLTYRLTAIYTWTVNGLKDVRSRIHETYELLDDWIVMEIKAENEAVNE